MFVYDNFVLLKKCIKKWDYNETVYKVSSEGISVFVDLSLKS